MVCTDGLFNGVDKPGSGGRYVYVLQRMYGPTVLVARSKGVQRKMTSREVGNASVGTSVCPAVQTNGRNASVCAVESGQEGSRDY